MLSRDDFSPERWGSTDTPVSRLGIAVIGAGRWGQNLVRVFSNQERARLVSVCDVDRSRLSNVNSLATRETSFDAVLFNPNVHAVAIATPPHTHAALAVRALSAHKHVFVEKPMALSLREALQIHRAAQVNRRRVLVGFVLQHHFATRALEDLVARGVLGQVTHVFARRGGDRRPLVDHPAWWSLAPHDVSLACSFLDTATRLSVVRRELANAVRISARISHASGRSSVLELSDGGPERSRRLYFVGTKRTALFDDLEPIHKLRLFPTPTPVPVDLGALEHALHDLPFEHSPLVPEEPLEAELRHFVEALISGREFRVGIEHALDVVAVLEAGERSMRARGAETTVPDWRSVDRAQLSSASSP